MTGPRQNHLTASLFGSVLLTTVIRAGDTVASKWLVGEIDVLSAAFYRAGIALLWFLLLGSLIRTAPVSPRRLGRWGWTAAVLGVLNLLVFYEGISRTSASHAVLILNLQPILVALLAAYARDDEPFTRAKAAGLIVAFAGIGVMAGGEALHGSGTLLGDVLVFGATVLWAVRNLAEKEAVHNLPPRQAALSLAVYGLGCTALAFIGASIFTGWQPANTVSTDGIYALAYLVIIGGAAMLIEKQLFRVAPLSLITSFNFLLPIWGVGLSALILHEALTQRIVLSMLLVAAGIAVTNETWRALPPLRLYLTRLARAVTG